MATKEDQTDTIESKRNALIESMQQISSIDPVTEDIHLKHCLSSYTQALSNDNQLQTELTRKLNESGIKNNSLQWKSNLKNVDFPNILRPSNNIENNWEAFKTLFEKPLLCDEKKDKLGSTSTRSTYQHLGNKQYKHNLDREGKDDPDPPEEKKTKKNAYDVFKTAKDEFDLKEIKKLGATYNVAPVKKKLGMRRGISNKFISPMLANNDSGEESSASQEKTEEEIDVRLKNLDPKMIELIKSEIMDVHSKVDWSDIAGLEFAKTAIQEAVVWPMLRPDIFTGLRRPPKGILLFGPPGTGKTLIGKCVASQSKSTFFSISASSLTSKWVGDGEKMVRALFAVARCHQPAVIFIDEIDSLLSQRTDTEHESSRRIKTEFLVQLDGATTDNDDRLLVIGATNRPQELDEAARRRFVKRLYIPLPEYEGRLQLVARLMETERNCLLGGDLEVIAQMSQGYSGADIKTLCSDACLGPIRSIDLAQIETIDESEVRPVSMDDFRKALTRVRSSVSPNDLQQYIVWDKTYGSGSI